MALQLNLPAFNGNYTVGIAAGADASLVDAHKMRVPVRGADRTNAMWADQRNQVALMNYRVISGMAGITDFWKEVLMGAALGIWQCGLIRTARNENSSDFIAEPAPDMNGITQVEVAAINAALGGHSVENAMHLVAATKVAWWKENHHVGTGRVNTYVKKVFSIRFPGVAEDDKNIQKYVHIIGHWAPTRTVLRQLGVAGTTVEAPWYDVDVAQGLVAAEDVRLRISSNPAGTARIYLAKAGAMRLMASVYSVLCPEIGDFANIGPIIHEINSDPVRYHIGAQFLCDQGRAEYSDTQAEAYLGRVGTYIRTCMVGTSLAKAPALEETRVKAYDDFSSDFWDSAKAYHSTATRRQATISIPQVASTGAGVYSDVCAALGISVNARVLNAMVITAAPIAGPSAPLPQVPLSP